MRGHAESRPDALNVTAVRYRLSVRHENPQAGYRADFLSKSSDDPPGQNRIAEET